MLLNERMLNCVFPAPPKNALDREKNTELYNILTRGINREKDGPSHDRTNQADSEEDLEKAQEKIVVQGRVHQDVIIIETTEVFDPSKLRVLRLWCVFTING